MAKPTLRSIEIVHTVPFHDLDPMHVVWHGNYFKYFDMARFALFKAGGIDLYDYSCQGKYTFPVSRSSIKHIAPLRHNDAFTVTAQAREAEYKIVIDFTIRLVSDGSIRARGRSEQVAVRMPEMTIQFRMPEAVTRALRVPEIDGAAE